MTPVIWQYELDDDPYVLLQLLGDGRMLLRVGASVQQVPEAQVRQLAETFLEHVVPRDTLAE